MARQTLVLRVGRGQSAGLRTLPWSVVLHAVAVGLVLLVPILTNGPLPEVQAGVLARVFVSPQGIAAPEPPPPQLPQVRGVTISRPPSDGAGKLVVPTTMPVALPPPELNGSSFGDLEGSADGVPGGIGRGPAVRLVGGINSSGPAAPPAVQPLRVSQLEAPKKLHAEAPIYPDLALKIHLEGQVVLDCTIAPDGRVAEVVVLGGHPLLAEAAVAAVRKWVYTPTRLGGVAVPVKLTVNVDFRVNRG